MTVRVNVLERPAGVRARAPLRLGLAGGGTDLSPYCDIHGGAVLNVTMNRFAYAYLHSAPAGEVSFHAADFGVTEKYSPDSAEARLSFHRAVHKQFMREIGNSDDLPSEWRYVV